MMPEENFEITNTTDQPQPTYLKKIKVLTGLNIGLLLLLVVLYVLFFVSRGGDASNETAHANVADDSTETLKIGFINAEVFNDGFKLARKFREELENEQRRLESEFSRRQRNLQNDIESFQRDAQTGTASADALQAREQELMRRQQELMQLNEEYSSRLAKREQDMMEEVEKVLSDFFGRYNLTRGYDFILRYTPIFGLYYANDMHDITQEVLEMVNAEFDANNL